MTLPHTALIYADIHDRNQLLKTIVKSCDANWNSVIILSSNPGEDADFFKGKEWRSACGKTRRVSIIEMKRIVTGKPKPTTDVIHAISKSFLHESGEPAPLVVGDWLHQVYERFDVGLAVETHHTRSKVRNLICCYRGEGFWSLDVKQIAQAFALHEQVLFGKNTFSLTG